MTELSNATVQSTLQKAIQQLSEQDTTLLDAQLILAQALGKSRTWLYAWPEHPITTTALQNFNTLWGRRVAGEPVAYILEQREFWSLTLQVSSAVLIPRPETELLVEVALELGPLGEALVADLGTGSGAIALALAVERPHWQVHAVERSEAAFAVAQHNFQQYKRPNLSLYLGSWLAPLPDNAYNVLVSNPPYIDSADQHLLQGDVRFEPRSALVAEQQGLADLQFLIEEAPTKLALDGWLLLEHGWQQGAAVRTLLVQKGYAHVTTRCDGAGRERVSYGCWPGAKS